MSNKTPSLSETDAKRILGHELAEAQRKVILLRQTRAQQPAQYAHWPDWLQPQATPFREP